MIEKNSKTYYTKQERFLISNIVDKYEIYKKTGKSTCSNFLNPFQLKLIIAYLNHHNIEFSIYEPYDFLEKKIIYFGNDEEFITFYQITCNKEITHSQVLGTLFSIGFDENTIGDILIENGKCYYTNLTRLNRFLEENLISISHQLVKLAKVKTLELTANHLELLVVLVSSMRLDNVVSKLALCSRKEVVKMHNDEMILLNYKEAKNTSTILKENDILSIRGVGKFRVGNEQGCTKKKNIILNIYKYI